MKVAATLAGIVGAKYINKIPGVDKIDSKLLAGIVIAAGYFVPGFLPAKFRPIAEGVGDGLMIAGGLSLLSDFGVLNGIPIVAGFRDLSAVNGVEEKRVTHKTFTESANDEVFRPSVSQIMNGYYYRRNKDGRR
jgi:hypothetical protein